MAGPVPIAPAPSPTSSPQTSAPPSTLPVRTAPISFPPLPPLPPPKLPDAPAAPSTASPSSDAPVTAFAAPAAAPETRSVGTAVPNVGARAPPAPPGASPVVTEDEDKAGPIQRVMWRESASPWSMDYEPKVVVPPQLPGMRDLTFTYLWGQKVYRPASGPLSALPSLRFLAKNFSPKVLQEGPKCRLVCRLMLRMAYIVDAGRGSWNNAFEPHRTRYYAILREKYIVRPMYRAPAHQQLLDDMPQGRERERHDRDGERALQFFQRKNGDEEEEEGSRGALVSAESNNTDEAVGDESVRSIANDEMDTPMVDEEHDIVDTNGATGVNGAANCTAEREDEEGTTAPPTVGSFHGAERQLQQPAQQRPQPAQQRPQQPQQHPQQPLTTSEFARLMAVLSLDSCRPLLQSSTLWALPQICRDFNNPNLQLLDTKLSEDSIDASHPPLMYRTAAVLETTYTRVRRLFARAHIKWSAARHTRGARGTPFASFVNAAAGTTALSDTGKMCCIMFAAVRCGAPDERTDLLGLGAADANAQLPAPRAHKRRRLSREHPAAARADARVTAAVHAALDKPAPDTDQRHDEENACCRRAVERTVASVAGSSVSAAVTAALTSPRGDRMEFDIVHVLATLKKLVAMRTDEKQPEFMLRYLDKEIAALRRSVERHQRSSLHS